MLGMAERMSARMRELPAVRQVSDDIVLRIIGKTTPPKASRAQYDLTSSRSGLVAGADAPISMGVNAGRGPLKLSAPEPNNGETS
jgi:hypothetical protein